MLHDNQWESAEENKHTQIAGSESTPNISMCEFFFGHVFCFPNDFF
jgi:hypothetical protein